MRKGTNYTRNTASRCVTARVMRAGQVHSKNFGLAEYKTFPAAERAAAAWVKKLMPALPDPIPEKDRMTKRNSSGIVGVQLTQGVKRGRWQHDAWKAIWPGKPGGVSWGVQKYGDVRAFVCAALARKLETTDRGAIEREYLRVKGTAEYRAILKRKAIAPA